MAKIQVPIDKHLRDGLVEIAHRRGFDSVQAYIRFWAKNEVDGRQVSFREDEPWPEPPAHVVARWEKESEQTDKDIAAGKQKAWKTADEALEYLHSL